MSLRQVLLALIIFFSLALLTLWAVPEYLRANGVSQQDVSKHTVSNVPWLITTAIAIHALFRTYPPKNVTLCVTAEQEGWNVLLTVHIDNLSPRKVKIGEVVLDYFRKLVSENDSKVAEPEIEPNCGKDFTYRFELPHHACGSVSCSSKLKGLVCYRLEGYPQLKVYRFKVRNPFKGTPKSWR